MTASFRDGVRSAASSPQGQATGLGIVAGQGGAEPVADLAGFDEVVALIV
jgi:hypothetical protein